MDVTNIIQNKSGAMLSHQSEMNVTTEVYISVLVSQVLSGSWQNVSSILTKWQMSRLESVGQKAMGIKCFLNAWLITQPKLAPGSYCNATWDNVYCWPPTQVGTTTTRSCSHAFEDTQPNYAVHLEGHGTRICLENGTWMWGDWTNYSECADSYEEYIQTSEEEKYLVTKVQHILFFGSILSIICLSSAVAIFYYFKCLWCDRVTIHIQLMLALIFRYILLFIITEPYVLRHDISYRNNDIICKGVLTIYLYSTVASINWMFIQGMYINGRLTTNIFNGKTPFKFYYSVGWRIFAFLSLICAVCPLLLLIVYGIVMQLRHPIKCWKGYSDMDEIWIVLGPILVALMVNFLFLINIVRILVKKSHTRGNNTSSSSDARQFLRAAKATVFLLPLLGVNNLLFVYNPGGNLHKYYVTLNSLFGSTQGIFVAIVYCYLSKDVRDAFRRVYRRFIARRNANRIRRRTRRNNRRDTRRSTSQGTSTFLVIEQPVSSSRSLLTSSNNLTCGSRLTPNSTSASPCLSTRSRSSSCESQNTIVRDMSPINGFSARSPCSNYSLSSTCSLQRCSSSHNLGENVEQTRFCKNALFPIDPFRYHHCHSQPHRTEVVAEAKSIEKHQCVVVSIPLRDVASS